MATTVAATVIIIGELDTCPEGLLDGLDAGCSREGKGPHTSQQAETMR